MKMEEEREWRVKAGQYLGEISALCFLHLPPHFSSFPYLLAGTGSQLLLFDINLGQQIKSFNIFEGVRVHGIAAALMKQDENAESSSLTFKIVVSGERRVKLYSLGLQMQSKSSELPHLSADLTFLQLLPRFTHWVLDFRFLQDNLSSPKETLRYLAVGCSDNSVHIWDTLTLTLIFEVQCPERCLLYSMRLWGSEFDDLHIASGTIYNEIVVWKLVRQHYPASLTRTTKEPNMIGSFDGIHQSQRYGYEAHIVSTLVGHQGSIFCLLWSSDGSKLISVSDDRSARMWIADTELRATVNSKTLSGTFLAGPMLFGHGARVWDCCISDSLIVTAGEDCTCRVWGFDGKELRVIKEHMGRGIWRCLYDPNSSLLVTAGFDSAIKAHCLHSSSSGFADGFVTRLTERREGVLKVCIPNLSGHIGLMDSKSEYVRCLKFARQNSIYVATNHGYVYHAMLSDSGSVEWTELARVTEEVPIICMDLLSRTQSELPLGVEDWVAVGDGRGAMKVIKVLLDDSVPKVAATISWSAEMERQLLGAYWCKSLGCGFIFTSNPKGLVKLWKCHDPISHDAMRYSNVYLIAEFMSPFGARIMCLDASCEEEVLVCGDLRGNLVLFPLLKSSLADTSLQSIEKTPSLTYFKGAHGISTVSSISIARFSSSSVEIRSTGADGCICYLEYDRDRHILDFVGMKQIKELSLVQSVSTDHYGLDDSANSSYAVGFSSTDFLIWNLLTETKLLQVKCGGWRRPHSYHLGAKPEICSSFAYVKDEIIYIHRYWVPDGEKNIFPRNLHLQFHGREIHSLCIVSADFKSAVNTEQSLHTNSTWIATGCEDGTVRLTRYSPGAGNWSTSNLLGEHVGGSAVRSLCFVSKVHPGYSSGKKGACRNNSSSENNEDPCLLISVGAKRVLTSWLLRKRPMIDGDACTDGLQNKCGDMKSSSEDSSSLSFKWLSTDMPVKCVRARTIQENGNIVTSLNKVPGGESDPTSMEMVPKLHGDALDNDWRYLAVTSFLVGIADTRLTVCFIVVACSDATLILRALILPHRYWFDVACLSPLQSPVLSLQHVVIPLHLPCQGVMMKYIYIAISGSTDGSIAFWDLTESVEVFMQQISSLHVEKFIDSQKRPRTGRGSQGGRQWRSINAAVAAKRASEHFMTLNDEIVSDDSKIVDKSPITTTLRDQQLSTDSIQTSSSGSKDSCNDSSARFSVIKPLHILNNVHQSGVNCLHICCQNLGNNSEYSIISGGDDQALNFLRFVISPVMKQSDVDNMQENDMLPETGISGDTVCYYTNKNYSLKFLCQRKAVSAHSSAVKGVWTDGIWVFSTGLDQRLRCWKIENHGNLTEHGHFITSVPEPEALDVRACGRKCYEVVVAGRGMQIVEFSVAYEEDGSG